MSEKGFFGEYGGRYVAEVLRQLDELRIMLGPQGKCQITAGEVTLLPEETLGRYIAYAISIGLDPIFPK